MRSLKSKVLITGLVLSFALIATFGTTYAWFTVSNTVTVNNINLSIKSSENLLMRVYNGETVVDLSDYYFYSGVVEESDLVNLSGDVVYEYVSANLWQIAQTATAAHWTLGGRNFSLSSGHLVETDVPAFEVISTVYDDLATAQAARDSAAYFHYSGTVGASDIVNLSSTVTYVFDTDHWTESAVIYVLDAQGNLVEDGTPANIAVAAENLCDDAIDAAYYRDVNLFHYSGTVEASNIVNLTSTETYAYVAEVPAPAPSEYELDLSGNLVENVEVDPETMVLAASIYDTEALALAASATVNTAANAAASALLLDATQYYYQLETANITAATVAGYDDLSTWTIGPVTALQPVAGYIGETVYGALNAKTLNSINVLNKNLTPTTSSNQENGSYIELKFWLFSQSTTDEEIVLSNLTIEADNPLVAQNAVVNALRVAVWKQADAVPSGSMIAGFKAEDADARIYSVNADGPDYDFSFIPGMLGYAGNYDDPDTPNTESDADPTEDYLFNASGFPSMHSLFYSASPVAGVSSALPASTTITTLSPNTPALVTVRIYLEGWDAQASNALLDSDFTISFSFMLKNSSL